MLRPPLQLRWNSSLLVLSLLDPLPRVLQVSAEALTLSFGQPCHSARRKQATTARLLSRWVFGACCHSGILASCSPDVLTVASCTAFQLGTSAEPHRSAFSTDLTLPFPSTPLGGDPASDALVKRKTSPDSIMDLDYIWQRYSPAGPLSALTSREGEPVVF